MDNPRGSSWRHNFNISSFFDIYLFFISHLICFSCFGYGLRLIVWQNFKNWFYPILFWLIYRFKFHKRSTRLQRWMKNILMNLHLACSIRFGGRCISTWLAHWEWKFWKIRYANSFWAFWKLYFNMKVLFLKFSKI